MEEHVLVIVQNPKSKVRCQVLFISFQHFGSFQGTDANPPARSMSADVCFSLAKPGWHGTNGMARAGAEG